MYTEKNEQSAVMLNPWTNHTHICVCTNDVCTFHLYKVQKLVKITSDVGNKASGFLRN